MARGKKYSDEIKERAFALLATSNNVQVVADTLGLPYNTVKTWEKKFLMRNSECEMRNNDGEFVKVRDENAGAQARELEAGSEVQFVSNEVYEENNEVSDEAIRDGLEPTTLNELRNQKKAEFVDRAWKMLERSQILLERRINRAYEQEDKIDAIIRLIGERGGADKLTQTDRNELYKVLGEIKLESTRSLSTLLGTLYDKQALAAKEPTVNVGGVLKFEDL